MNTQFSFIWPIQWTLAVATTLGQSGPGSVGSQGVLCIAQSSCIARALLSDCLLLYLGLSLVWEILPICREPVGIFYSPSRQGNHHFEIGFAMCPTTASDGLQNMLFQNGHPFKDWTDLLLLNLCNLTRTGVFSMT